MSDFIYDEEQHGCRAGKSVTTASIDLIETIVSTVYRGDSVTGVFIDLSKAIDSVHHVELLNALDSRESRNYWLATELV